MENHHVSWENPLFLWPFSIAMLVHQRVNLHFPMVFPLKPPFSYGFPSLAAFPSAAAGLLRPAAGPLSQRRPRRRRGRRYRSAGGDRSVQAINGTEDLVPKKSP